jgi:hypothetical protein
MLAPKTSESTKSTRKIKNKTFATEAAPAAIPPNPKIAATIAIIRKVTVQRNIRFKFNGLKYINSNKWKCYAASSIATCLSSCFNE